MIKFLKLSFDRSFSGKSRMQLCWLMSVILFVIVCIFLLKWVLLDIFNICCLYDIGEIGNWRIVELFLDPGAFVDPSDGEISHTQRIATLIIALVGAVLFTGMLVSVISNMLERRVEKFRNGNIYYKLNAHFVILGYDQMTQSLIKQICGLHPKGDIVLQTTRSIPDIRQSLHMQLTEQEERRLIFVNAQRDSEEELRNIYIHLAKEVFILGETQEADHDAVNLNCIKRIVKICRDTAREEELVCNTLLNFQSSFVLFQRTAHTLYEVEEKKIVLFRPFNFCETWARKVFVTCESKYNGIEYRPLDYIPITENSNNSVHLVVIGMTDMGIALATQAALIAHYPNFRSKGKKTRITFIDMNAMTEMEYFTGRYRSLFEQCKYSFKEFRGGEKVSSMEFNPAQECFMDLEWDFIQGNIADYAIQGLIKGWCDERQGRLLTIAVCFNHSPKNIATGLYLPDTVYDKKVPVLVQQETSGEIIKFIKGSKFCNVLPFGMKNDSYELDMPLLEWAKKVNYLYDYFSKNNKIPEEYPQNEVTHKWRNLIVSNQWSNIYNASTIPSKLRSVGLSYLHIAKENQLSEDQINMLAEVEHNRWNTEKMILGYRAATEDEKRDIKSDVSSKKKEYKSRFIHYDIGPFDNLQSDGTEGNSSRYDYALIRGMIDIICNSKHSS